MKLLHVILLFTTAVTTGIGAGYVTRTLQVCTPVPNETDADPVTSSVPKRFLQIEARLTELIDRLDSIGSQSIVEVTRTDLQQTTSHLTNNVDSSVQSDAAEQIVLDNATYQQVQNQIMDSLLDPTATLQEVLQSTEMQSLPLDRQNEVLKNIADRINSGLLIKDQFLPGYLDTP
jgi:hypothetical protein